MNTEEESGQEITAYISKQSLAQLSSDLLTMSTSSDDPDDGGITFAFADGASIYIRPSTNDPGMFFITMESF